MVDSGLITIVFVLVMVSYGLWRFWPGRSGAEAVGRTSPEAPVTAATGEFNGRVGGAFSGYDIQLSAGADGRLTGRFGGALAGKDLNLHFDGTVLSGRYGGAVTGQDLSATVTDGVLRGRLGGGIVGRDLNLDQAGDQITGRVGGAIAGFDLNLFYDAQAQRLGGRLGGAIQGETLDAALWGIPPLVAAAVAAAVHQQRLRQKRH